MNESIQMSARAELEILTGGVQYAHTVYCTRIISER